jgi:glutamate racemase
MDSRPVGVFDSGVGGLSVLREFRRLAPAEDVVYLADTANFPYGPRPAADVRKHSFAAVQRLLAADAKLIIVACNTASAAAIADLRETFPVPFVGMVPGLKPAAQSSRTGTVAILATPGTLDGGLYARVMTDFGATRRILNLPGDGLAELVERGDAGTPAARAAVREVLGRAVADGADTIVLGCTHYAFLARDIESEFPGVSLVDTSEAVARRALAMLNELGLAAPEGRKGRLDIIVSGDRHRFYDVMARIGFAPAQEEVRR